MRLLVSIIVLVTLSLSGCMLAPAIESFKKIGVTSNDRAALLPQHVKKFNDAVYWGRPDQAIGFMTPDCRKELGALYNQRKRNERLTDSSVESVNLNDDSREATVDILVRFLDLKAGTNVVNERRVQQDWVFSVSTGWQLKSEKTLEDS